MSKAPACTLCYDLDDARIRKLTENTCSIGQAARHWMSAEDLRAAASGARGSPCRLSGLLRDAMESFLWGSGLVANICSSRSECDKLKYNVAFEQKVGEESDNDSDDEDAYREDETTPSTSDGSWVGTDKDSWNGEPGTNTLNQLEVEDPAPEILRIVARCNLVQTEFADEDRASEEFNLDIFAFFGEPAPNFPMVGSAGEVHTDPIPEKYAETITGWLQSCLESHTSCTARAAAHGPGSLPRRVLDLANDKIVLIESEGRSDLYVALSHCWGKEQLLTTTRSTLVDRMSGIAFEAMPRTFQDAVLLTRALGLRYLWIDSLCIIQQDIKDWQEQSAVMADIYAGCYLNIATTRSPGGKEGFLKPRWTSRNSVEWMNEFARQTSSSSEEVKPVSQLRKCDVKSFPITRREQPDLYQNKLRVRLRLNSSHESMQAFRWITMHKETAPLIQRGWVYQERTLSPRTVHFHANEMMWDCIQGQRCECLGLDGGSIGGDGWSASKNRITSLESLDFDQRHGLWRTIVEDYCLLDLTYDSDRLPALSGIATRFSDFMPEGDEYLAGLWRSTLARDLLWESDSTSSAPGSRLTGPNIPPSWSWASLIHGKGSRGVRYEYETKPKLAKWAETVMYRQDPRFSIISASCKHDGPTAYGCVSGGSITVTGAVCAIAVSRQTKGYVPSWAAQIPFLRKKELESLHLTYDDKNDEDEVLTSKNPNEGFVFCLMIGTFSKHFDHDLESHRAYHGLILKPCRGNPKLARRIGSWKQYIEDWVRVKTAFTKGAVVVKFTIV